MAPPFAVAYLVILLLLKGVVPGAPIRAMLSGNTSLIATKGSALHTRGPGIFATSLAGTGVIDLTSTKGLATAAGGGGECPLISEFASRRRRWWISLGGRGLTRSQWYVVQRPDYSTAAWKRGGDWGTLDLQIGRTERWPATVDGMRALAQPWWSHVHRPRRAERAVTLTEATSSFERS